MAIDKLIQAKAYRLEELRKYQSYYGPNTPYPVIVEINRLETELRRLLQAGQTRPTPVIKKQKKKAKARPKPPTWQVWRMSQATIDLIATIAFIGLVFLFGSIVFAAYVQTRPTSASTLPAVEGGGLALVPTLRPTFTPTGEAGVSEAAPQVPGSESQSYLPTPGQMATDLPTPVPTLTPSRTPEPTLAPEPTATPEPTHTPPPPPTAAPAVAAAAAPPAAPTEPPPPPEPSFPFMVAEQGNREFQKTTYPAITIYVAVVSEGNIPLGGYKVVGDHVPMGLHIESELSTWDWSVVNCLDCDYVKQGNLKLEPGPFIDGIWNIYLADPAGNPQSPMVSLPYSSDPNQWVWDFIIFKRKNG